jgi:hypothetical protein
VTGVQTCALPISEVSEVAEVAGISVTLAESILKMLNKTSEE